MRILEERHPGESWLLWKLGNWTTVPVEWVASIGLAVGFKDGFVFLTRGHGFKYFSEDSLFWNAALFVRLVFPLGVYVQVRWSGNTEGKAYVQFGLGYKLNGRFGALFRIQSDDSAKVGAWSGVENENFSSNHGTGWALGHK